MKTPAEAIVGDLIRTYSLDLKKSKYYLCICIDTPKHEAKFAYVSSGRRTPTYPSAICIPDLQVPIPKSRFGYSEFGFRSLRRLPHDHFVKHGVECYGRISKTLAQELARFWRAEIKHFPNDVLDEVYMDLMAIDEPFREFEPLASSAARQRK